MPTYFEMAARLENGEPISWNVLDQPDLDGDYAPMSVEPGTIMIVRTWNEGFRVPEGFAETVRQIEGLVIGEDHPLIDISRIGPPSLERPIMLAPANILSGQRLNSLAPPYIGRRQIGRRLSTEEVRNLGRREQVQVPSSTILSSLKGSKWHVVERWVPLTQEKAREGMLRLLTLRWLTQPRAWFERVTGTDEF